MKMTLVSDTDGEWEGLYVDGKLVYENHRVPVDVIISQTAIDFDSIDVNMEEKGLRKLPSELKDL